MVFNDDLDDDADDDYDDDVVDDDDDDGDGDDDRDRDDDDAIINCCDWNIRGDSGHYVMARTMSWHSTNVRTAVGCAARPSRLP